MSQQWKQTAVRRLIEIGRTGAPWAEIGPVFYPLDPDPRRAGRAACQVFCRYATKDDRHFRSAAIDARGRHIGPHRKLPADIEAVIALARRGDTWAQIGRAVYPSARSPATAACELYRRYATDRDRDVRAAALRARNWNKPPGLSPRSKRHRNKTDKPVIPQVSDPWDGSGECFA